MKELERNPIASPPEEKTERRPYEPPRIVWQEDYEPVSFGVSCAKQPGNFLCVDFFSV
jgi:hypothetical protein